MSATAEEIEAMLLPLWEELTKTAQPPLTINLPMKWFYKRHVVSIYRPNDGVLWVRKREFWDMQEAEQRQ